MVNRNPLTLSRQELYDLVWSKPVTEVDKEIGLSDVAVAKRCRQVQVPVPPRGYWARVAAGQTPRRIPLPKYRDSANRRGSTRMASILSTPRGHDAQPESHGAGLKPSRIQAHPEPTVTFHGKERDELAAPVSQSPHRVALARVRLVAGFVASSYAAVTVLIANVRVLAVLFYNEG